MKPALACSKVAAASKSPFKVSSWFLRPRSVGALGRQSAGAGFQDEGNTVPARFEFGARGSQCHLSPMRCLTLRSSGPPPAWRLAREAPQVIVPLRGPSSIPVPARSAQTLGVASHHPFTSNAMCLAVYIGSDLPINEIAWSMERPAFHLTKANDSDPVRQRFAGKYVYYAGSHEGCGCGFEKNGAPPEELATRQANYDALARALGIALQQGARPQVFTCWEGDQADEAESTESVSVGALAAPSYELQQLELLNVTGDA